MSRAVVAALLVLAQSHQAAAFFRLALGVLVTERADPIISPGGTSGHAHAIGGGNGFGTIIDYAKMRASTCTTAPVKADKSAYWTPLVYFHHKNGSFIAPDIGNQGQQVYYGYNINEGAKPFPEGLRIVAGKPYAREAYTIPNARTAFTEFDCLDYKTNPKSRTFPTQKCPYGVRANVYFPSCGNGQTDSADHMSHMAYRLSNGDCPSTHPNLHPELHYELYWSNNDMDWSQGMNPAQPFVFSHGDPTGWGFHGDFFNGWPTDLLGKALKDCDGGGSSGEPNTCVHFQNILNTGADINACKKTGDSPDLATREVVRGWLPKLPGCNPVTTNTADALAAMQAGCNAATGSTSSKPSSVSTTTSRVSPISRTTSASTSIASATTTKTSSAPATTATTATSGAGSVSFAVFPNIDSGAGNIGGVSWAGNEAGCQERCKADTACKGYTFVTSNKACYLKSDCDPNMFAQKSNGINSGVKVSSSCSEVRCRGKAVTGSCSITTLSSKRRRRHSQSAH